MRYAWAISASSFPISSGMICFHRIFPCSHNRISFTLFSLNISQQITHHILAILRQILFLFEEFWLSPPPEEKEQKMNGKAASGIFNICTRNCFLPFFSQHSLGNILERYIYFFFFLDWSDLTVNRIKRYSVRPLWVRFFIVLLNF